jgi:hypothetical protein
MLSMSYVDVSTDTHYIDQCRVVDYYMECTVSEKQTSFPCIVASLLVRDLQPR